MSVIAVAPPESASDLATERIQSALDKVGSTGGGRVTLAAGSHLCGTLTLHSRTELHLESGAVLKASSDPGDFVGQSGMAGLYGVGEGAFIIQARDAEQIAVTGLGVIDGSALDYMDGWRTDDGPDIRKPKAWRPRGIGFHNCRQVTLRDFTFRDSASWTIHLTGCEIVLCQSLTILNRLDVPNCDGIDPDHCRNVRILGCHIEAADDCIVLKNTRDHADCGPCEDILIADCQLVSTSTAIKIGTESAGDFRNILVDGCIIRRSHRGLSIQLRDGGTVENVAFSNCTIETLRFHPLYWGNGEPIYVTSIPRNDGDAAGKIRDIRFHNIRCRSESGVFIQGSEGAEIEGLLLDNVSVDLVTVSKWPGGRHDLRPAHGEEHGGLDAGEDFLVWTKHARVTQRNVEVRDLRS
jgi:polygalacturonase